MRIDEYVKEEKDRLDNFRIWWATKRRTDTTNYPSDMCEEAWFEQYLAFMGLESRY